MRKFTNFDKSVLAKISVLILDDVDAISLSELINAKLVSIQKWVKILKRAKSEHHSYDDW